MSEPNPLLEAISDEPKVVDKNILTMLEVQYWLSDGGEFMSRDALKKVFKLDDKQLDVQLRLALAPLKNRGLPVHLLEAYLPEFKEEKKKEGPVKISVPKDAMDPEFVLACNLITDTFDKRTLAAKLKAVNITTTKWKAMLKNPKQREFFEKQLNESYMGHVESQAKMSIARNVEAGDLQSIKYFMEHTGKYRPDSEVMLNFGIIIGKLMEVLAKFLTADQLNQVADELEGVIEASATDQKELTK